KHAVLDQADLKRGTLEALARPLLENDLLALRRGGTQRALHAAGVLVDRSVGPATPHPSDPTHLRADRARRRRPGLAAAPPHPALARLGIASAADAVAFFRRHPGPDFRWLKLAVRLPDPPEYYGKAMDLAAEIDRGDVWYDFPFDAAGARLPQPRE